MKDFVTILRFDDGVASYQVYEQPNTYSAELIKSTSCSEIPKEIVLTKPIQSDHQMADPVMNKLVHAIQKTESIGDE